MSTIPQSNSSCLLLDNGSLKAIATLNLRRMARLLSIRIGREVVPVSLLHSTKVPVADLDGIPAELLEKCLRRLAAQGVAEARILPFFFGPSGALTDYVPEVVAKVAAEHPGFSAKIAASLVDVARPEDARVAKCIARKVLSVMSQKKLYQPKVLLVDHGSPVEGVASVRNLIGTQLRAILGPTVTAVGVASMERRDGAEYDFNEPLLERALAGDAFGSGEVIIALQFLAPGRHAGHGGDIDQIRKRAEVASGHLRTFVTEPIGTDEQLVEVLVERYMETCAPYRNK